MVRGGVPVGVVTQGSLLRWYGNQMAAKGIATGAERPRRAIRPAWRG